MTLRRIVSLVVVLTALLTLAGCQSLPPSIPAASEFQVQAIGTLMPGGHDEIVQPHFAPNSGGALFINETGFKVQIAVSGTIATLPIAQDFLFILPPGAYQFYLYQPDLGPRAYTETIVDGKLRYVYLSKAAPG